MKLTFSEPELTKLAKLRDQAKEVLKLEVESKFAREKLPELLKSKDASSVMLGEFLPSQLLAFGPDISRAWQAHQRAVFLHESMQRSRDVLDSELPKNKRKLELARSEIFKLVYYRVRDGIPPAARTVLKTKAGYSSIEDHAELMKFSTASIGSVTEKAENLVKLAEEFGAELSGASA